MLLRFARQADLFGFDPVAYRQALDGLPILTVNQVEALIRIIQQMVAVPGGCAVADKGRLPLDTVAIHVNERLKSEIQRRRLESWKLNQIVNGNPMATFVIDAEHNITHWNHACEVLTGLPAKNMIGTDDHHRAFYENPRPLLADLMLEHAGGDKVRAHYNDILRKSPFVEDGYEAIAFFPKLGRQGKWLFFTAAAMKDADGRAIGAIETFQDISESHLTETRLQESVAHYRQLFESANDAIFFASAWGYRGLQSQGRDAFRIIPRQVAGPNTRSPLAGNSTHR